MKCVVVLVFAVIIVVSVAPLPARSGAQESKMKNLKVLTGMSDSEVNQEMQVWAKALGVKCSHCHQLGDFVSDENPKKDVARQMVTMVKTLNKDFFKGARKADCMLCHRGAAIPATEP